ncbi:MAG TPA: trypsin-like serine protease [Bdellovibrio sp.]|uniref:trypsin-like serine peptidase n=1 Tax=Bdellovibrio sp. TaxID=28201 RepID=UPI002EFF09F0
MKPLKILSLLVLAISFQSSAFAASLETKSFHGTMGSFSVVPTDSQALPGKYLRKQITDSSAFANRVVGRLVSTQSDSLGTCTATLIGNRYLLTAAHCVYNIEKKSWPNDFRFIPGQTKDKQMPFGIASWDKVYIHRAYFESTAASNSSRSYEHDYAVIVLKDKIGDRLGWMGVASVTDSSLAVSGGMSGYPSDKERATLWSVACPMVVQGNQWMFQCDAFQGMSGSALHAANANGEEKILGVFDWVQENKDGVNGGVVIDDAILAQIKSWIADAPDADTVTYQNNNVQAVEVYIRNQCVNSESVSVAFSYLSLDMQWVTSSQWVNIPKGETRKILTTFTQSESFHLLGSSKEGFTWGGDFGIYFMGRVAKFKTVPLDDASRAKGIMIYSLSCP